MRHQRPCDECSEPLNLDAGFCHHCGAAQPGGATAAAGSSGLDADTAAKLVYVGAGIVVLGVFLPVLSIPVAGSLTYFNNGQGDGVVVMALAGVAALVAGAGYVRRAWIPAALAGAVMVYTLQRFMGGMADVRAQMQADLEGNPFAGLGEIALSSVQLQFGWVVLFAGAGIMIFASVRARD